MTDQRRTARPLRLNDEEADPIVVVAQQETEGNFSMAVRKLVAEALQARALGTVQRARVVALLAQSDSDIRDMELKTKPDRAVIAQASFRHGGITDALRALDGRLGVDLALAARARTDPRFSALIEQGEKP